MAQKAVVSLTTGAENLEKVTVAFLVAVGAAETGRETLMFLTPGGRAPRPSLGPRPASAATAARPSSRSSSATAPRAAATSSAPSCVDSRKIDASTLIDGAELNGTIPMWNWIGDDGATTFSY